MLDFSFFEFFYLFFGISTFAVVSGYLISRIEKVAPLTKETLVEYEENRFKIQSIAGLILSLIVSCVIYFPVICLYILVAIVAWNRYSKFTQGKDQEVVVQSPHNKNCSDSTRRKIEKKFHNVCITKDIYNWLDPLRALYDPENHRTFEKFTDLLEPLILEDFFCSDNNLVQRKLINIMIAEVEYYEKLRDKDCFALPVLPFYEKLGCLLHKRKHIVHLMDHLLRYKLFFFNKTQQREICASGSDLLAFLLNYCSTEKLSFVIDVIVAQNSVEEVEKCISEALMDSANDYVALRLQSVCLRGVE